MSVGGGVALPAALLATARPDNVDISKWATRATGYDPEAFVAIQGGHCPELGVLFNLVARAKTSPMETRGIQV